VSNAQALDNFMKERWQYSQIVQGANANPHTHKGQASRHRLLEDATVVQSYCILMQLDSEIQTTLV
jgi:hypothetical protein